MKSTNHHHWAEWRRWLVPSAFVPAMLATGILVTERPLRAAGVVTSCTETSLRTAMAGGGTVAFACDGTIILGSTITNSVNTVLDGAGHQITISGGNKVRVFTIDTNVTFTAANLTIANGYSDQGAGICNLGGQVILQNCTLVNHLTQGHPGEPNGTPGTNGIGGAVYNLGDLKAFNCSFISNSVVGGFGASLVFSFGQAGGHGIGGAIGNFGSLVLSNCLLANNSAWGGAGGFSGWPGVFNTGEGGGRGGDGDGGAIGNFGSLAMACCSLTSNSSTGGNGGKGGDGPQDYSGSGWGGTGGPGGSGGGGNGGAVFNNGSAALLNNTFALNVSVGGQGADAGNGGVPFAQYYPSGNGGAGGTGGSAYGAIYDANGQCSLTNCTIALNVATGGIGGIGGLPGPYDFPGPPVVGSAGPNGSKGSAGGLGIAGARFFNTLLSGNTPTNCIGTITDAGHNLSSDASCAFTGSRSMTNTDPKLGPLADNGGPTLTMALLPGSPAIDAGSAVHAPATDQRGIVRPQGPGVDIGAFEFQYIPFFSGIAIKNATNCQLQMAGLLPNQSFTVQASSNLLNWLPITNFVAGTNGLFQMVAPAGSGRARFYRVASGAP
jgi:hypothetical protein